MSTLRGRISATLPGLFALALFAQVTPAAASATDVAVQAGIYEIAATFSAAVGDYNSDGWDDVVVVRHASKPARLWRNNANGTFTQVATFPRSDRHHCAWADVNADGLPDLYCTRGAGGGSVSGKYNEMWMQGPPGIFADRAAAMGALDVLGRGRAVTFIDVNHDAFPDLFVGNDQPRADGLPTPNRLLINAGGAAFVHAPSYGLDLEIGGYCAESADWDGDGWEDLLVCTRQGARLYHNDQGQRFRDVTQQAGATGFSRGKFADVNADGRLDLVELKTTQFRIQLQTADHRFGAPTNHRTLTSGYRLAVGDVNRDALPDVYILQTGTPGNNAPDIMLVRRAGTAVAFDEVPVPQTSSGMGDAVEQLDYDRNGATDFIVLNGGDPTTGPVQLIAFT